MKARAKVERLEKRHRAGKLPVVIAWQELEKPGFYRVEGESLPMAEIDGRWPESDFTRIVVEYVDWRAEGDKR